MARPPKEGIDYFSLDVGMGVDDEIELIDAEFGLTGFAVIVKLYQRVYRLGYYCEWTNEVALLFAKRIGLGGNVVSEIVNRSIERGIFDKNLFEKYSILTSSGIQKRYFEAVSRRKEIFVNSAYLLINVTQIYENSNKNPVIVYINSKNVSSNPQSKVKESKVSSSQPAEATAESLKFLPDSIEYKSSDYLRKHILERSPNAKVPKNDSDLQKWCKHIDLILRVDKRTPEELRTTLRYAVTDDFWSSNILSPKKLRDKFDELYIKATRQSTKRVTSGNPFDSYPKIGEING